MKKPVKKKLLFIFYFLLGCALIIIILQQSGRIFPSLLRQTPSQFLTETSPGEIPRLGVNYVYHGWEIFQKKFGGSLKNYLYHQDDKLNNLGSVWVRSAGDDKTSLAWKIIEPSEGKFDFSLYDLRLNDLNSKKIWSLGEVDFSPKSIPEYAKTNSEYGFADKKYLVYLNKIVERYDGDGQDDQSGLTKPVKYWEIGNEPGAQSFPYSATSYSHLLEISYKSIKANCADCQVLIAGFAIGQLREEDKWQKTITYLGQILKAGGGQYFDIMNYHEYTNDCDFLTYYHVNGFKELLNRYGLKRSIWITEANTKLEKKGKGKYSDVEVNYTLAEQAQDIIKRAVVAFDAGVDVFFWHRLDDISAQAFGVGLFDENDQAKPNYYNLQLLRQKISNFIAIERINLNDKNNYFYKFTLPDSQSVYVLWTENEQDSKLDLSKYFNNKKVSLTYAIIKSGKKTPDIKKVDSNNIPLSKTPIFIN